MTMHESGATTREIPATKRRVVLKSGDTFAVTSGSFVTLRKVLKGHGQRVVVEITTPGVTVASMCSRSEANVQGNAAADSDMEHRKRASRRSR